MKKGVRSRGTISNLASVATILTFLFSVSLLFFPQWGQNLSQGLTGAPQMTSGGDIRPEFIASQVNVMYWALGILVMFGGLIFAFLYDTWHAGKAQVVTTGESTPYKAAIMGGFLVLALILLSVSIPSQIFQLTSSSVELQRQAGLFAWPARSALGGVLLGLIVSVASLIMGFAIYMLLFQLPRVLQEKRLRRQLTRAQV